MAPQRSLSGLHPQYPPEMRARRPPRGRRRDTTNRFELSLSRFADRKLMAAAGGGALMAAAVWILTPFDGGHALAELLRDQGYWEIAAPAEFYLPGTIQTIELRGDGKIALHPTCTIGPDLLAKMTVRSRTVDRHWEQQLDKKFDVSGRIHDILPGGLAKARIAKVDVSFRNSSILQVTDEDLWRLQREVVKETCSEAIEWNIKSGGRVCQTRSALRGDLVYDISYRTDISIAEKGKLTGDVAAALKLDIDQGQAGRVLGSGLIYGVSLMPAGIVLNTPDARPIDCRLDHI